MDKLVPQCIVQRVLAANEAVSGVEQDLLRLMLVIALVDPVGEQ